MSLSWIPRPTLDDLDTLVARGKYAKAARVLRTAFESRQPTLAERLRYADLLVLAEQGEEALPVLLGVAEEQGQNGLTDKAIEALRRAQAIDPANPGVRERLKALQGRGRATEAPATGRSGERTLEPERVDLQAPSPAAEAPGSASDVDHVDPEADEPELDLKRLHAFLLHLGRTQRADGTVGLGAALFAGFRAADVSPIADGLRRRRYAPGDVLVTEGDPGHSVFFLARGSVRVLVRGGHGQPFDVRRLDEGDSFGEVAVLYGRARSATVVAATPCDVLEADRGALETLLELRPKGRRLFEETARARRDSAEEMAARSLPAAAADPERAAEALRSHFGGSEWSFPVRLHLSQLMMDVGRQDEALAILASVAEDLARAGHAQKAIAVLKKVEWIRRRGGEDIQVAPPRKGRRRSARPRPAAPVGSRPLLPPDASAATHAAFREWVGSMLRQTHALAARTATPREAGDEAANGDEGFARRSA